MNLFCISLFVFLISYTSARVITTNVGETQDVDVYQVQEDTEKHTITLISPKSMKPTLREIIYYHVIEKPFENNAIEPTSTYYNYPALPEAETVTKFSSTDSTETPVEESTIQDADIMVDVTVDNDLTHSVEEVTDIPIVVDISTESENILKTDTDSENNDIPIIDEIKSIDDVNDVKTEYDIIAEETEGSGVPDATELHISDDFVPITTDTNENYNVNLPIDMDNVDGSIYAGSDAIQPEVELLSRYRRDVSDEPHTYGMEIVGDHGTVWNDVSARNLKYEVGSDGEVITDNVEVPQNEEIPINLDDVQPQSDSEIIEDTQVSDDKVDLTEGVPEEIENIEDGHTPINNIEVPAPTEPLPDENMGFEEPIPEEGDDAMLRTDGGDLSQEVTDGDTKQWGMSLNHDEGTVWNGFNGKPIEYQVGTTAGPMPIEFPGEPIPNIEDGQIPINNIEVPAPTEPLPAENMGFEETIPEEGESNDDIFVTPPTRDLDEETTITLTNTDELNIEDNIDVPATTEEDNGDNTVNIEGDIVDPTLDSDSEIDVDMIPVAPTLPPLNVDDLPIIDGKSIPIDGDMFTDVIEDTTELPEDVTTEERFMSWIQTWAAAYTEIIKSKITEFVKEEVTKQMNEVNLPECCSKPENFPETTESIDGLSKSDANKDAKVIYGNSVGNENVTNVFLFVDNVSDKIVDILKPLIEKEDGIHYISTNMDAITKIIDDSTSTPIIDTEFDGSTELHEVVESTELPMENRQKYIKGLI